MKLFAEHYIQKNVVYPPFIPEPPQPSLATIVIIPCLNEPEIIQTLESLWNCTPIESTCEVIVTINNSELSPSRVKDFNRQTLLKLIEWKAQNDRPKLALHPIYANAIPSKFAGAGMARKIGMDEAIRRFNHINNPDGIIVSLDADCLVSENYLKAIEQKFQDKNCFAATINFSHRIDDLTDEKQKTGIRLYENYLHYYKKALDFTGFPDSIDTIGSAFAVRAEAYVKQGGMNRRQAGEDFYFLNKLTKLGRVDEIAEATVFPSGRVSDRVPFGTGAAMSKWMNADGDLTKTYNFAAFRAIKSLFDCVDSLFRMNPEEIENLPLPESILDYLSTIDFSAKVLEINKNSSSLISFRKRFFQFFDAFVIMRFLNISHQTHYQRQNLEEAIAQLELHFRK
ncbi:MAG: glycosyltransferase family 2 protein [Prolixibacteraceae bacterium]|nr:glycosyltransferase family 2 protein [Prolixibacteraceae bacterium]